MNKKSWLITLLLMALLFSSTVFNGTPASAANNQIFGTAEPTVTSDQQPAPDKLQAIYDSVWSEINDTYYNPSALTDFAAWKDKYSGKLHSVDELESALQLMVGSLHDHWTKYTPLPEIQKRRQDSQTGLVDLGMMLQPDNGVYKVWYVAYGSPAWMADIRRNDIITQIGGKSVSTLTQEQVNALLVQQSGTAVVVADEYDGINHSITLSVTETSPDSVQSEIYSDSIGYIRFPNFDDESLFNDFRQQLAQMYVTTPLKAIVLDLRGNPGGRVDEAIGFVSLFMKTGVILNVNSRSGRYVTSSKVSVIEPQWDGGPGAEFFKYLETVPLFVLVDGSSASAAEIATGAFKDSSRAVILGTTTWGKGVGYDVYDQDSGPFQMLPTGGILQITTQSFTTPNGENVQGVGVPPNVFIEQPRGHTSDVQLDNALAYVRKATAS